MERFTKREDGKAVINDKLVNLPSDELIDQLIEQLAIYEDSEDIGTLRKLKAPIGATIYHLKDNDIRPYVIEYVYWSIKPNRYYAKNGDDKINFRDKSFGRDIFFTYEEAQMHLDRQLKEIK